MVERSGYLYSVAMTGRGEEVKREGVFRGIADGLFRRQSSRGMADDALTIDKHCVLTY